MLFILALLPWLLLPLIPKPRKRQTRAAPERTTTAKPQPLPDPDEIQFLLTQREQLFTIAAEIDEMPDGERKTRKQIAIDKQIFNVDKKLKRLYN